MGERHAEHRQAEVSNHTPLAPETLAPGKATVVGQAPAAQPAWTGTPYRGSVFKKDALPWSAGAQGDAAKAGRGTDESKTQDDSVRARAIVAGFHAAQRALESGADHSTRQHLEQVVNATLEYGGRADAAAVMAAANAFDGAMARATKRRHVPSTIVEVNTSVRRMLALPDQSSRGAEAGLVGGNAADNVIDTALDVLALQVRDTFSTLETTSDSDGRRGALVTRIADEIEATSSYLLAQLKELPENERASHRLAADKTAQHIGRLLRWVRTRTPHRKMEADFARGTSAFDRVLQRVGGDSIEARDAVQLSERAVHGAEREQASVQRALDEARAAVQSFAARQDAAITTFQGLALLDDVATPDFKAELLKGLIAAAMGNILTSVSLVLATRPPVRSTAVASPVAPPPVSQPAGQRDALARVLNVGFSSVYEAVKGTEVPSSVEPRKRALHFFAAGLIIGAREAAASYLRRINNLVNDSEIAADELQEMARAFDERKEFVFQHYLEQATQWWATYLARARLGTQRAGNGTVSAMTDYFGIPRPGGRQFGTSRAAGDGVLAVHLCIDAPGTKPRVDHSLTKVVGLNSELKGTLLRGAGYSVARVALPKEIHIEARFARATIALDENNRIRDVSNWEQVRPYSDLTPYAFWKQWCQDLEVR